MNQDGTLSLTTSAFVEGRNAPVLTLVAKYTKFDFANGFTVHRQITFDSSKSDMSRLFGGLHPIVITNVFSNVKYKDTFLMKVLL